MRARTVGRMRGRTEGVREKAVERKESWLRGDGGRRCGCAEAMMSNPKWWKIEKEGVCMPVVALYASGGESVHLYAGVHFKSCWQLFRRLKLCTRV